MSEKQKVTGVLSGTKRRQQHDIHNGDRPISKTRRRLVGGNTDDDFHSTQIGNQDGDETIQDSSDDIWDEDQHGNFVSALFEVGLKEASPAIILENMTQKVETITSERVKSKLQKYRSTKNKESNKQEFMKNYYNFLQKVKTIHAAAPDGAPSAQHREVDGVSSDPILRKLLEDNASSAPGKKQLLLGGDVAGYLTHCVTKENEKAKSGGKMSDDGSMSTSVLPTNVLRKGSREYVDKYGGRAMRFPILTETEKKSSLGIAMTFIAGLFLTMSQHLTRERARAETIGLKFNETDAHEDDSTPTKGL